MIVKLSPPLGMKPLIKLTASVPVIEAVPDPVELLYRREASEDDEEERVERRSVNSIQMQREFDRIRDDIERDARGDASLSELLVSSVEGLALMVSSSLLAAIVRGGSLVATALSSLPMWRRVDPLAVLALSDEERRKREMELRAAAAGEDEAESGIGRLLDDDDGSAPPPDGAGDE